MLGVLLNPWKELIKNKNIDVYMASLLDELLEFWKGVHAWDVIKPIGDHRFTMHVLLMWSVHDLPAYGLLVGQTTKGYKGCPTCKLNTSYCHSWNLGEMVYESHRRWLRPNHPYESNTHDFNGKFERNKPN
jgi:hypothetical protein